MSMNQTTELKEVMAKADTPDVLICLAAMIGATHEQKHPEQADAIVAAFGNYTATDYTAAVELFNQAIIIKGHQRPEVVQAARAGVDFIIRRFQKGGENT